MEKTRRHYFPANDCVVITGLCPSGEYGAYREEEDHVRGHGHSRLAAISDLADKTLRSEEAEFDRQAAAWDHARDLRKNWVA